MHLQDDDRKVRVTPRDKDLMILSVQEAIIACRAFADQIRFQSQFDALLAHVGAWIRVRLDKISAAYVTTRDAGLMLLIVTRGGNYDVQFESAITELDMQIANDADFRMIDLSMLAIPYFPAIVRCNIHPITASASSN